MIWATDTYTQRMATTIRVSTETRDRFADMAARTGRPMTQLLGEAADALERRLFFAEFNLGYERLRGDPDQWEAIERERNEESGALLDRSA